MQLNWAIIVILRTSRNKINTSDNDALLLFASKGKRSISVSAMIKIEAMIATLDNEYTLTIKCMKP